MDPKDPSSFNHRTAVLSTGRKYHFVDQISANGSSQTLLLVHGFPDCWYGYRNQIGPWVRKGYRVVVPDMLGYGGTDKPKELSEYTHQKLCNDLAALLDFLGVHKAILVGHDWGSLIVSRFALWHPDRLRGLVLLATPYWPRNPVWISIEEVARRAPNLAYQLYFANETSTKEIEARLPSFLKVAYNASKDDGRSIRDLKRSILALNSPDEGGSLLNSKEFEYYLAQFQQGGMQGPLSYYRTLRLRYEEEQAAQFPLQLPSDLPVLFVWGGDDPFTTPGQAKRSRKWIPQLTEVFLDGKGHWLMIEADVTGIVLGWLDSVAHRASARL